MTARISHTSVDCGDAYALSLFWAQVLGFAEDPDDPNEPGHEECMIAAPDGGQRLLFIEVPESKTAKNRLHLDLGLGVVGVGEAAGAQAGHQAHRLARAHQVRVDQPAARLGRSGVALVQAEQCGVPLDGHGGRVPRRRPPDNRPATPWTPGRV